MPKYIDADELIKKLGKKYHPKHYSAYIDGKNDMIDIVKILIAEMHSADVVEVKHGEWIDIENNDLSVCSQCNKYYIDCGDKYEYNFCPRCGVDMRRKSKIKKCFDIPKDVAEKLLEDTERKESEE